MRSTLAVCFLLAAAAVAALSGLPPFAPGGAPQPAEPRTPLKGRGVLGAGLVGGDFSLTDLHGRRVTGADYGERHLLLTFGVPASGLSSLVLDLVAGTLSCLGRDSGRLQAVFISLDPAPGGSAALGRYLASFDRKIAGLRGSEPEIRDLARRYRVRWELGEHSAFLYLVEPGGRLHSYYPPSVPAADLCADLRGPLLS